MLNLHWPMYQEEIQVICSQIFQGLVERAFDIFRVVLRVPKLACDEDVFAIDAALSDALSHGRLVAVNSCGINVAVAGLECRLHGLDNLVIGCLPCAKSHSGDFGTGVQGEMCRERHYERVDARWFEIGDLERRMWWRVPRIGSESCQARKMLESTPALFNQGSFSKNRIYSTWRFFFDNFLPIILRKKAK